MASRTMISPFIIDTPRSVLERIMAKVRGTRIGYAPADDGAWKYGTDAKLLRELVAYWGTGYDWRAQEAKLNRWPQFRARIDGLDIHFIHVRGNGSKRLPLLLTHGWPGSVVEFQVALGLLNAQGYDVVVPSLPGHGWSQRPATPIGPRRVAELWCKLMTEALGYAKFGAQGGDWGSAVTAYLGAEHADAVAAIHLNLFMGPPAGPEDDDDSIAYRKQVQKLYAAESAYMFQQQSKPQTLGLALHDNPIGWASWVIEKFHGWGDTKGDVLGRFSMDVLITNLMTYLVNDAVISSFWMYYGARSEKPFRGRVEVPTGLALYPAEFFPYPGRRDAERVYNVQGWAEMEAGGHFAALEEPEAFAENVGEFFSAFRG